MGLVIVGFGAAHYAERKRVLNRQRELKIANTKLAEANFQLDQALQRRSQDLQELRDWASEEPV